MRTLFRFAPLAVFVALLDCRSLPAIASGTCGNGVIDPGEDCDTFAPAPGTSCRAPGTPGQCRLDCTDGSGNVCPSGWGCGTDGICRQPSGQFTSNSAQVAAGAWRVMTGDFDGDGRADVLSRGALAALGYSKVSVLFYDAAPQTFGGLGAKVDLASTLPVAPTIASPVLADFDGDSKTDLGFVVASGFDVMLGQADRTLQPVVYGRSLTSGVATVVASLHVYGWPPRDDIASLGGSDGGSALIVFEAGSPKTTVPFPGEGPAQLAGAPSEPGDGLLTAPFVDTPAPVCDSVVVAFEKNDGVDVYTPCVPLSGGAIMQTHVALPPGKTVHAGVRAADVDGDGHLDLLVGSADPACWVAYGDGTGHFHDADGHADRAGSLSGNTPGQLVLETGPVSFALPLAAGDLNGDGRADFVTSDLIITSVVRPSSEPDAGAQDASGQDADAQGAGGGPTPGYFLSATRTSPRPWTAARIADMNGDGLADVVAASAGQLDVDFFVGTGTAAVNPFTITTVQPVDHLAVGDFDGDRIDDVALAVESGDGQHDALLIAWGQAFSPPAAPTRIGAFDLVDQLVPVSLSLPTRSDIQVVSHASADTKTSIVSTLLSNGDRLPLAPFQLRLPGDATASPSQPVGIAAGPFRGTSSVDVFAVAADRGSDGSARTFRYWLVPGASGAQFGTPMVSMTLPPSYAAFGSGDPTSHDGLLMGWGRVGPGQAPRAVAMAPDGTSTTPKTVVLEEQPDVTMSPAVQVLSTDVSPEGQLALDQDLDGDGARDMVLLTGSGGARSSRQLLVQWNDGSGGFTRSAPLVVNAPGEQPQGFAFVAADTSGRPHLAYVTSTSLVLATIDGRAVSARQPIEAGTPSGTPYTPRAATGIAAGDVDGDGVEDLAVADGGSVVVLLGTPVNTAAVSP